MWSLASNPEEGKSILHQQGANFFPTLQAALPEKNFGRCLDFISVELSPKKLDWPTGMGNHKEGDHKTYSVAIMCLPLSINNATQFHFLKV